MTLPPPDAAEEPKPWTFAWEASAMVHAGRTDRLDVLLHLADSLAPVTRHVTTAAVSQELQKCDLLVPEAMDVEHVDGLAEIKSLVTWAHLLSSSLHDRGEATICAWAEVHRATAIIDDGAARRAAAREGLDVHGTAWVIAQAVNAGAEKPRGACALLQTLIADGARYPFHTGDEFLDWAKTVGLARW